MVGELAHVPVVPGRVDAAVAGRDAAVALPVPADTEPVPVRCLGPHAGVQALVDQAVLGPVEELADQQRFSDVCVPAAHQRSSGSDSVVMRPSLTALRIASKSRSFWSA